MKSLIVGLGFGNAVYKPVFEKIGSTIVTVDPIKDADFKTVEEAIDVHKHFDTVNICTPNFTHEDIARKVAKHSSVVFIEKPGVLNSQHWKNLVEDFPETRFMMVKNNQYRTEINEFHRLAGQCDKIYVRWNNANRIPNPGSWFTTKELAFGGVSRDLIPHMLSYYCELTDFKKGNKLDAVAMQNHLLSDITSTDYGTINHNGVYDVDDFCKLEFKNGDTTWILSANWKTNLDHDDSSISFTSKNSAIRHVLGMCPEEAYKKMIETAVKYLNNDELWNMQLEQDIWIHQQIEDL
jgi:predicted dehydrogenase